MKRFLILLSLLFCNVVFADTINLHWLNEDGTVYENSTCVIDSDLILPATPPTKYGYTFTGWQIKQLYTPIEYLESTGTQWIDTGLIVTNNMHYDISFVVTDIINDGTSLLGSRNTSSGGAGFNIGYNSNKTITVDFFGAAINDRWLTNITIKQNKKYRVKIENKETILYEESFIVGSHTFTSNGTTSLPLLLCTLNNAGAVVQRASPMRFYFLKVYNNDSLVRDLIPVLDGAGTPCMFDRVTGQFFYNQGTGQFIAGPALQ